MDLTLEEIEFTREEVPVSKKLEIDGSLYTLEIRYNETGDFYTSILYDDSDNPLVTSKLVYLGNAFNANVEGMPSRKLVPLNISDLSKDQPEDLKVNYETFGDKVRLYLI